jgi:hypothetical protein
VSLLSRSRPGAHATVNRSDLPNSATPPLNISPCSSLSHTQTPTKAGPLDGKGAKSPTKFWPTAASSSTAILLPRACLPFLPVSAFSPSPWEPDIVSQGTGFPESLSGRLQIWRTGPFSLDGAIDQTPPRPPAHSIALELTAGNTTEADLLFGTQYLSSLQFVDNSSAWLIGQGKLHPQPFVQRQPFFYPSFRSAPLRFAPCLPLQQESESIPKRRADKLHWATPRTHWALQTVQSSASRPLIHFGARLRPPVDFTAGLQSAAILTRPEPSKPGSKIHQRDASISTQRQRRFPFRDIPFRWLGVLPLNQQLQSSGIVERSRINSPFHNDLGNILVH